jgi:hypothetical protein
MGADDLREHALSWRVTVTGDDKKIHATVRLENGGSGHAVPTGLPGRRLTLRARLKNDANRVLDVSERVFARIVVDETGREVPFYAAVRVASDSRIAAGASRTETFDLNAPSTGELELELVRAEMGPAVTLGLGLPAEEESPVLTARVPFGLPRGTTGRALLPKSVTTSP